MSKLATFAAALTLALALSVASAASHASVIHYATSAYDNTTGGGTGANATTGVVHVDKGSLLDFNTDINQMWAGAFSWDGNYAALHTTANGSQSPSWKMSLSGMSASAGFGALVAEIGGSFRFVGAGDVTLTAWNTGDLHLWFLDSNQGDNSGIMNTSLTVTQVPEPGTLAIVGLGLLGLARTRRRNK